MGHGNAFDLRAGEVGKWTRKVMEECRLVVDQEHFLWNIHRLQRGTGPQSAVDRPPNRSALPPESLGPQNDRGIRPPHGLKEGFFGLGRVDALNVHADSLAVGPRTSLSEMARPSTQ